MPTSDSQPRRPRQPQAGIPVNPYYGYGYRPDWPSILSVAHDVADGGALFIITDRPCTLGGPTLPLQVAGKSIIAATTILPVKFRVTMSGAIPRDSAWTWGTGTSQLVDAVTGHAPNPASGNTDDIPGPYTPPPPANVVSTSYGNTGTAGWVDLTFDQPTIYNGAAPDSSIIFLGTYTATTVTQLSLNTLRFDIPIAPGTGGAWAINNQPGWIDTPVVVPQSGTL